MSLKDLLRARGIEFEEKDISGDPSALAEMQERSGKSYVPQVFIGSEYIGGYDDWQRERAAKQAAGARLAAASEQANRPMRTSDGAESRGPNAGAVKKARKLSNKERTELEALPGRIEALESEQAALTAKLADPTFFKTAGADVAKATARLHDLETEIAAVYARWGELEGPGD